MSAPVALITGGAKRIGAAIVRAFHDRGCNIVLHYRSSVTEARQLADELNATRPDSVKLVQAALDSADEVRRLAEDTLACYQRLDYLINNASTFYPTPILEATEDDWDILINSNLRSPFRLLQHLVPALKESQGAVVNVVDIYADNPLKSHTVYCIAKAGLAMLTKSAAVELGPDIRVNAVSPGAILWPETMVEDGELLIEASALKRLGTPLELATTAVFLAMDATYVTGNNVKVDGGRALRLPGG